MLQRMVPLPKDLHRHHAFGCGEDFLLEERGKNNGCDSTFLKLTKGVQACTERGCAADEGVF